MKATEDLISSLPIEPYSKIRLIEYLNEPAEIELMPDEVLEALKANAKIGYEADGYWWADKFALAIIEFSPNKQTVLATIARIYLTFRGIKI